MNNIREAIAILESEIDYLITKEFRTPNKMPKDGYTTQQSDHITAKIENKHKINFYKDLIRKAKLKL